MCRRNSGQSRRKRRICSRILVCSPALRSTTIEEGTVIPPTTRDKLALSGVADRNCRCHSLLQCVRPITWFDLGAKDHPKLDPCVFVLRVRRSHGGKTCLVEARSDQTFAELDLTIRRSLGYDTWDHCSGFF